MASERSISDAATRYGQWLSAEVINRLPQVKRSFDLSRDPYIRAQLLSQSVQQDNIRGESSGRGSGMVKRDKPAPALVPPQQMRGSADRQGFQSRWLVEQRDATLARAAKQESVQNLSRAPVRGMKAPSR